MKLYTNVKADVDTTIFAARAPYAAHVVAEQAERDMRGYIPSKRIVASADVDGNKLTWNGPRTRLFFFGRLYVDPEYNVGGFLTKDGWRSRRGVQKVRSSREIKFRTGGPFWTQRAAEQNITAWIKTAKEALLHGP